MSTLPTPASAPAPVEDPPVGGVILAGGRGMRMGGVEKGLLLQGGEPMIAHAIRRLRPQVGALMISANRERERYEAFGLPVVPDTLPDVGPLGGVLAALLQWNGALLASAPCDSPSPPADLVARLRAAVEDSGAPAATVRAGGRVHPVFALYRGETVVPLERYLTGGRRSVLGFLEEIGAVVVDFEDAGAFGNVNTPDDLRRIESAGPGGR